MRVQQAKLIKELAALRKGEGMTPAKLQDKQAIRTIATRILLTPVDNLANNQVYNFLLAELATLPKTAFTHSLENAFGINAINGTLATRRHHFAVCLSKHPDTIERYENKAINSFATHLIGRSTLPDNAPSLQPSYLQEFEAQTHTLRAMTSMGLSSYLSIGTYGEDLMKYLELSCRPYLDASVHIHLLPSSLGNDWFRFKLTYSFKGPRKLFRVAVVLNTTDGENLMASGLIDDFHQLNHFDNPKRDIKAISANSKFILKNLVTAKQKLLRLQEIDNEQAARILQSTSKPLCDQCWILGANIPPAWQTPETTYEHHSIINLDTKEHYAYWYAPALMYLKKLTFDFSEFPRADSWNFSVQPFLGHSPGTIIAEKQLYTLHLSNWVMPGHGIILLWK